MRVRVDPWIDIDNYKKYLCMGLIMCLGVIVYWGMDEARVHVQRKQQDTYVVVAWAMH